MKHFFSAVFIAGFFGVPGAKQLGILALEKGADRGVKLFQILFLIQVDRFEASTFWKVHCTAGRPRRPLERAFAKNPRAFKKILQNGSRSKEFYCH